VHLLIWRGDDFGFCRNHLHFSDVLDIVSQSNGSVQRLGNVRLQFGPFRRADGYAFSLDHL
jgi:hypothetical protein